MQNNSDQLTEAMRNGSDRFVVSETWHETPIDDLEDTSFVFDGSIGRLIENAAHLTVALRRAFAAVHACALSSSPGHAPTHETRFLAEAKVAALAPTSAMICCAESTPKPGTSASRWTAS